MHYAKQKKSEAKATYCTISLNDIMEKAKLEGREQNCCWGGDEDELDYQGTAQENWVGGC